jgi:hypothetical protein
MALARVIPFSVYQRISHYYRGLSARERTLLLLVTGTVFILANLALLSSLAGAFGELRHECAEQAVNLETQQLFASEQPKMAQRMSWLHSKQPVLASRDRAGAGLLEQIQQFARGSAVIVTNPRIKPPAIGAAAENRSASTDYQAITVEVDTQSDWAGVEKFIENLQQPENFLVFNLATLRSETDPAVITGHFQISKWYAPAH